MSEWSRGRDTAKWTRPLHQRWVRRSTFHTGVLSSNYRTAQFFCTEDLKLSFCNFNKSKAMCVPVSLLAFLWGGDSFRLSFRHQKGSLEFALWFSAVSPCCVWQEQERMQMNDGSTFEALDKEKRNADQQERYCFKSEWQISTCAATHTSSLLLFFVCLCMCVCVGLRVCLAFWRKGRFYRITWTCTEIWSAW